jgi:hypothetical protein
MIVKKDKRIRFKTRVTDEMHARIQASSTQWANQVYDQAESIGKLFVKNFRFLCKKHNITQRDAFKHVRENGFKFREERMSEFARLHAVYPTIVEICFFSKIFGVSPGEMISKDFEAIDLLRRNAEH